MHLHNEASVEAERRHRMTIVPGPSSAGTRSTRESTTVMKSDGFPTPLRTNDLIPENSGSSPPICGQDHRKNSLVLVFVSLVFLVSFVRKPCSRPAHQRDRYSRS